MAARPRFEPAAEALPDVVSALDLARSALLALDVAGLAAEQEEIAVEALRLERRGEAVRPVLAEVRARAKALDAARTRAQDVLIRSQLTIPAPIAETAVLSGRVVDEGSGAKKVTVVALGEDDQQIGTAVTDERGQYVLQIPATERSKVRLEVRKGRSVLPTNRNTSRIDPGRVGFQDLTVERRRADD